MPTDPSEPPIDRHANAGPGQCLGSIDPLPVTWLHWLLVTLIVASATLPFLNKAFHIDDVLYLRVADQILRTPLNPYEGVVLWDAEDGQPASLFETDFNPPLWKYCLAATIALFGREEWKLHLLESFFVWWAGFGVFQLSRRFSPYPVWCTGMIMLSPFFLPGQNIMLEGPMLCLAAWAVEWQCMTWQTGRLRWSWVGGLCLALAVMTKYTTGVLFPLLFAGSLWVRKPASLVVFVAPAIVLVLWAWHNLHYYGALHLGAHGFTMGIEEIPVRALTVLRCVGSVIVLGPAIAIALLREGRFGPRLLVTSVIVAVLLAGVDYAQARHHADLENRSPTLLQAFHYGVFTFHGAICCTGLAFLAVLAWKRGERDWRQFDRAMFLEWWLVGMLIFNVVCVPFNAIRHLLFFFIPMHWLVADWMGRLRDCAVLRRNLFVISSMLALALATADYQFAGAYRELARTDVRQQVRRANNAVWFTGNWGFCYYAVQERAYPLLDDPQHYGFVPLRTGDIVFLPRLLSWRWREPVRKLLWQKTIQPPTAHPFRTVAPGVHFYAVQTHALPWEILIARPRPEEGNSLFKFYPIDEVWVLKVL